MVCVKFILNRVSGDCVYCAFLVVYNTVENKHSYQALLIDILVMLLELVTCLFFLFLFNKAKQKKNVRPKNPWFIIYLAVCFMKVKLHNGLLKQSCKGIMKKTTSRFCNT